MKHSLLFRTLLLSFVMTCASAGSAFAEWGTQKTSQVVYEKKGEIMQLKAARTSDGYTYLAWIEWNPNWKPASTLMLCMQLLDPDGNPCWGDQGMIVDDYPSSSYTTQNRLVVDEEGNAYVSWADCRSLVGQDLENTNYTSVFEPVIYKMNKDGEMLWGENGKTYDSSSYSMNPILYYASGNLYAMIYGIGSGSYIAQNYVRLDKETGDFASSVQPYGGQIIGSEGSDIIRVYSGSSQTLAMRYDKNFNEVWNTPAVVANEVYSGHNNFPYSLYTDYQGGVIVSFQRFVGETNNWMPIVNYITADGESTFGRAVDVTPDIYNNNDYNMISYNPQTESIFNVWGVSGYTLALYGQLMDIFGERMWSEYNDNTENGKEIAYKISTSTYSYAPLGVTYTKDNTYCILYVDESNWMTDTMYIVTLDEEGNVVKEAERVGPFYQGIANPHVFFDNGDLYMIYYNYVSSTNTYRIRAFRIPEAYEPAVSPENPSGPDNPGDTGVDGVVEQDGPSVYYSLDGMRLDSPRKGLNIVKDANGKVRKVMVK